MWTRTLSTTISTSPSSAMARLSHARPAARPVADPSGVGPEWRRTGPSSTPNQGPDDRSRHEPSDVGEERHPAIDGLGTQRCDAVDELKHKPEPEHDDRGYRDELVEETKE